MKKIYVIIAGLLITPSIFAQTPEKISYQAVIRDGSNELITNTQVGMQISIFQGTVSGNAVYVETQTPTANSNGLVSLEIGTGATSDDFTTIDWANEPYFIKTETDPTGGTNHSITGTSQLMSVPYALYAKNGLSPEQASAIEVNSDKIGLQNGTTAGEMQYWNGTDWVNVEVGTTGQILTYIDGKPMWLDKKAIIDPESGFIFTWKDIKSSATGQIWMDRNLGASQVAESSTDEAAFGDLYQWGRQADGHQLRDSKISTSPVASGSEGSFFIITTSRPHDWLTPQDKERWNSGSEENPVKTENDPCPTGYRVPTISEWKAELDATDGIKDFTTAWEILKLIVYPGVRGPFDFQEGEIQNYGSYWSSTSIIDFSSSSYYESQRLLFGRTTRIATGLHAEGGSVRCIKISAVE